MRKLIVSALALAFAVVAPAPGQAVGGVPTFSHVFVIVGENTSLSQLTAKNARTSSARSSPKAPG
jgi:hypothetical protein